MGNAFAVNDNSAFPAPAAVHNWHIYLLAISASMGSSMFGYDSAFIGGSITLPSFQARFGLASASGNALAALRANIVSTFQAGCFFGAIICYPMTERLGRRIPLMICGVIFDIGAVIQVASTGNLGMIYAGRALTGLAVGASSLMIPVYISESSPPAIRGRLIGIFEILLQFSQIFGFWDPIHLTAYPRDALVIMMFFQPESPRWLLKAGRKEQAIKDLTRIRRLPADHPYLQWEVDSIEEQLQREYDLGAHESFFKKLKEAFMPGNRNRLILGMSLMMLQNLSGINALNYYSPTIFRAIGFKGASVGLLATGIFGIIKAFATLAFILFGIDKLGRRKSLMIGSVGALVAMYYLGAYTKVSRSFEGQSKQDGGAYVAIVMIYLFACFYAMSWNGIPWIFCAEVYPTAIRSVCLVFTTCTQWLGQFTIVYSTPYMMTDISYGTFFFFGSSLIVGILVVYFFMPETKGLALEDMDIMFNIGGLAGTKRARTDEVLAERRGAEEMVGKGEVEDAAVHVEGEKQV